MINMIEKNIVQAFRLKELDEKRNYFTKEIKQNELIIKKHQMVCKIFSYAKHLLILASTVTGCLLKFCFFNWHSYRHCKFCSNNKNLCNNCGS